LAKALRLICAFAQKDDRRAYELGHWNRVARRKSLKKWNRGSRNGVSVVWRRLAASLLRGAIERGNGGWWADWSRVGCSGEGIRKSCPWTIGTIRVS
jgi:hypothetical protein